MYLDYEKIAQILWVILLVSALFTVSAIALNWIFDIFDESKEFEEFFDVEDDAEA